jgi:hypothetical protein
MEKVYGFFLFLGCFLLFWWIIVRFLRNRGGMVVPLQFDPGLMIRESGWGSACVNGVSGTGCFKLIE